MGSVDLEDIHWVIVEGECGPPPARAVERERIRQIARIGNNLNQLARRANIVGSKQGINLKLTRPLPEKGNRLKVVHERDGDRIEHDVTEHQIESRRRPPVCEHRRVASHQLPLSRFSDIAVTGVTPRSAMLNRSFASNATPPIRFVPSVDSAKSSDMESAVPAARVCHAGITVSVAGSTPPTGANPLASVRRTRKPSKARMTLDTPPPTPKNGVKRDELSKSRCTFTNRSVTLTPKAWLAVVRRRSTHAPSLPPAAHIQQRCEVPPALCCSIRLEPEPTTGVPQRESGCAGHGFRTPIKLHRREHGGCESSACRIARDSGCIGMQKPVTTRRLIDALDSPPDGQRVGVPEIARR